MPAAAEMRIRDAWHRDAMQTAPGPAPVRSRGPTTPPAGCPAATAVSGRRSGPGASARPGNDDRVVGLDPPPQQRPLGRRRRAAAEVRGRVARPGDLVQRERAAGRARVVPVGDAHEPVPEDHLPAAGYAQPEAANEQVPALQVGLGVVAVPGQRVDLHADERRAAAEQLEQRRQHDGHRVIGDRDGELPRAGRRFEIRRHLQRRLRLPQGLMGQRQGPGGQGSQHVAAADPDQQLVVKVLAQPGQRRAHRGLAHVDPLARAGQVALLEQRPQGHQEVQVGAAKPGHVASPACRRGPSISAVIPAKVPPGRNRWHHAEGR